MHGPADGNGVDLRCVDADLSWRLRCCGRLQADSKDARAAAEKFLTQFRATPDPYRACLHVLANSSNSNAQFQSVSTVKDAVLREWNVMKPAQIESLRMDLLQFAAAKAGALVSRVPCGSR